MYPDTKLIIFGTDKEKLSSFSFADETYLVWDVPADVEIDHAFRMCGRRRLAEGDQSDH